MYPSLIFARTLQERSRLLVRYSVHRGCIMFESLTREPRRFLRLKSEIFLASEEVVVGWDVPVPNAIIDAANLGADPDTLSDHPQP